MYSKQDFTTNITGNLYGGVTAAIVALPLALAFGIASGAGAISGLYGAIIVGFFAAIFGGTATQISGPTGPMTVVLTAVIAEFTATYPQGGLALAFTVVFLGGCLQVIFGLMRVGQYIIMIPYPVISGFMSGIGVIIIILQFGPLMGYPSSGGILDAIQDMPVQLGGFEHQALVIGLITLAIIYLWRGSLNRIIPAPLFGLVVGTLLAEFVFSSSSMPRIGEIPSGFPSLRLPEFELDLIQPILVNALMLAVLGSIDSLLTSLVADNMTATRHHSDRELIGQGIGNALSGLFGGLPGAGATMRTVVNIRAGGSGPLSGASHALVLLAIVSGFGFLFEDIPQAVLAAILIKVGIDIIDWPFLQRIHRLPYFPVLLMTLVLILTVFVDLITAVFVGVFIKNLVTINNLTKLQLSGLIISDGRQNLELLPEQESRVLKQHAGDTVLFRITGPVSYAVGRGIGERFKPYQNSKLLLIDISDATIVGISTTIVLEELIQSALLSGTRVKLIGAYKSTHRELQQLGLIDLVGKENCVDEIGQAF